jgi:4-hydroxythreonine-4-phosphate dehydrogenase
MKLQQFQHLSDEQLMEARPRLLITMGDVAGIGPEIIAKAWPELCELCTPLVVGDAAWLARTLENLRLAARVVPAGDPATPPTAEIIPVIRGSRQDLSAVTPGKIDRNAGRAAYDFLCTAIDWTLVGKASGIVTAPLQKEGLHAAGLRYPGHTEILAERTGSREFGMMLYARGPNLPHGLGVVHVTLHMALRDVLGHISSASVLEKIRLLDRGMRRLCGSAPRLGVAGLNPHAGDGGLFGDEERALLTPAVSEAVAGGISVTGPWPADTLFVRAQRGEFDGIVAMYHDQGHIPMKLLSGLAAVNVTLGLPIVRTSVAHGTAYDIAGKGVADHRSLVEAAHIAAQLVKS